MSNQDLQDAMAKSGALASAEERRRRAAAPPTTVRRRPVVLSTEQRHQAEIAHLKEVIDRLEEKVEKLSESLSAARSQLQPVVLPRTLLCGGASYHTTTSRREDVARIAELEKMLADREEIIAVILAGAATQQSAPAAARPAPAAARPATARTVPSSARPAPSASARPVPSASARPATGSSTSHFVSEASIYTASMEMTHETTIRGGVTSISTERVVRRYL